MDKRRSAPHAESASDEEDYNQDDNEDYNQDYNQNYNEDYSEATTCNETADDDNANDSQILFAPTDPYDPRFTDDIPHQNVGESLPNEDPRLSSGDPLLHSNIASDVQCYIHDEDSTYLASSTAYQYASPDFSTPSPWQGYETVTLGLNLDWTTQTSYSPRLEYTPAGPSFSSGNTPYNSNGDASVVWNPNLPPNYIRQSEDRNQFLDPSGPSIPSAPSIRSAQSALSIPFSPPTTNLTSYYPETPRWSRPPTERSFEERAYTCDFCDARFPTSKDLKRHLPIHNQAPEGEKVDGNYHCRCGYRNHRKDNYKRHHRSCVPGRYKREHAMFICACNSETNNLADHLSHIDNCEACKKPRGRPPRSRATSFNEYS